MVIGTGLPQMKNIAWLATLMSTSKIRATPCFAFDRWTRNFLTTLDESFVSTARQHIFDVELAFNRGKVGHLVAGHSTCSMTAGQLYILDKGDTVTAIDTTRPVERFCCQHLLECSRRTD